MTHSTVLYLQYCKISRYYCNCRLLQASEISSSLWIEPVDMCSPWWWVTTYSGLVLRVTNRKGSGTTALPPWRNMLPVFMKEGLNWRDGGLSSLSSVCSVLSIMMQTAPPSSRLYDCITSAGGCTCVSPPRPQPTSTFPFSPNREEEEGTMKRKVRRAPEPPHHWVRNNIPAPKRVHVIDAETSAAARQHASDPNNQY